MKSKPEGPFHVFGMIGNIAEWVQDNYASDFYSQPEATQPNPIYLAPGEDKVYRGGNFYNDLEEIRTAHRGRQEPNRAGVVGLRVAYDP